MPYLTAHSCRYFIYMAKLIRCILTVGGNFKMPRDSQGEDGKNIWKDEKTTVSNRELKSMVEFYKKDLVPKYDIPEL